MTILDFFKTVHPSVLAAKMIFRYLQEHYPIRKISEIAETTSGGTPNRGMLEYYNGDIPWVKSGELKDGLITSCDEFITEAGLKNSSAKLFPKGTLLVAMYGANIGKTGVLDFDATTNQAVCAIFPKVDISKDYLFWYFKQQRIDFIEAGKGGAQPNISQTVINNASIVVPDENTQRKIVDFLVGIEQGKGIDEKFFIPEVLKDIERIYKYKNNYVSLCESFEIQLSQLENLNQAILQEAVQGKLLPQNPTDEPASHILKRIKAEKEKLINEGRLAKDKMVNFVNNVIPFNIPDSWVWCRLNEIADALDPNPSHRMPRYINDGIPFISTENFREDDSIDFSIGKKVTIETLQEHIGRYEIHSDSFAFSRIGSIGKTIKLPMERNYCLSHALSIINPFSKEINLQYLRLVMSSSFILKQAKKDVKSISVPDLGMAKIRNFFIPLPPLFEQTRIVAEIEKQLAKTKQLKEHIITNQQATEQLLKALLHEAFSYSDSENT